MKTKAAEGKLPAEIARRIREISKGTDQSINELVYEKELDRITALLDKDSQAAFRRELSKALNTPRTSTKIPRVSTGVRKPAAGSKSSNIIRDLGQSIATLFK